MDFWKVNEEVNSLFENRWVFADVTMIVFHFGGIVKQFLAFVALIASSVLITAVRTMATHESISQKQVTLLTVALGHFLLLDSVLLLDIQENILTYLSVPFG